MNESFDVIIIGGGPGGTPAAMQLAARGKKVMLAEASGKLGGACLFVGCIPSKIIKHGADKFAAQAGATGAPEVKKAWREIRADMARILEGRSSAALGAVCKMGIRFVPGAARFVSGSEVEIGGLRYGFTNALIATGSRSFIPPFRGDGAGDALTSETLFQQKELPGSLVIIGGGPIGVELAQMLNRLKVRCTVLEMAGELLQGAVEPEFAEAVTRRMTKAGITVHTGARVEEINRDGGGLRTVFTGADGERAEITSERVLVAAGRLPVIEELNLAAAGVRSGRGGIAVTEHLETSAPGIYAVGDVVLDGPKFAHLATHEAHLAAANILNPRSARADFAKNSWALFSSPEIASAGLTEAQAVKAGFEVVSGVYDYKEDATAQINGNPYGFLKFVAEKNSGRILGVHLMLDGAASLSGEAAALVARGLTLKETAQIIHPHPTLTEAFGLLAFKMLSAPAFREKKVSATA